MTRLQVFCILIPAAYVLGSTPFGLIVGKARGIDPRTSGSGNIGATNLGRLLGKKYFWIVFFLDLLKGLLPTLAAGWALNDFRPPDQRGYLLWIAVGFAAILGHGFSMFLSFKGGKGVSTSAGVILGIFPYLTIPALMGIVVFLIILKSTRYMSIASMTSSSSVPVFYVILSVNRHWPMLGDQLPILVLAIVIPLLIIYKHRGNIQRLKEGTENRIKPA